MEKNFLPKIEVISGEVKAPPLGSERRIAVLLPHDYNETTKRYPVIYLQDGQNLFERRSPFGNWHVDRQLSMMAKTGTNDIIVIAIDHAEKDRVREFSPPEVTKFGTSFGRQYARFMVETLKPYVDKNFRTLPYRQQTGIGGSSMGALISIYCGFIYPEVFGKMMIFSPALWVAPKIYFQAINFFNPYTTKIYLYAGGKESENMVPNVKRLQTALQRKGLDGSKIEFHLSINPDGEHNEARWGEEFPKAVKWLYFED
ncbi:MAG: alpha/beta hydrolase [Saprospiraceae bacterium]|nr:MAG: alpha/beta hydrolase [Saprospiraceae bacterium]